MFLAFIYSGDVNRKKVNDNKHNTFNFKYLLTFQAKIPPPPLPKRKKLKINK